VQRKNKLLRRKGIFLKKTKINLNQICKGKKKLTTCSIFARNIAHIFLNE